MVPSVEAKKEIVIELLNNVLVARDGRAPDWTAVRDEIDATIREHFPERIEEWRAISFDPSRIRDVDDPEGWERLCQQARSEGFEHARLLIQSIRAALSAAPAEPMPPVGILCREILQGIFAIAATKPAKSIVTFSPDGFLPLGIAKGHAERALENLTRRNILKRVGGGYTLDAYGKDLLDDPEAFDRELPRSTISAAATTAQPETDAMSPSPRTPTRLFISHAHADEPLATAFTKLLEAAFEFRRDIVRCTSVEGYKLDYGDEGPDVLRANLADADVVLGLLTPTSLSKPFVLMELGAAWGLQSRIIPALAPHLAFDEVPPPIGPFRQVARLNDATDVAGLIASIAKRCDMVDRGDAGRRLKDTLAFTTKVDRLYPAPSAKD